MILSCDTPSHDGEQMCQMILKSHNEWHSYGQDKLIYGHFWPLNSKCDLDLGDIDVIISRDTPSNDGEQMCQMILKSDNERHSYGPDKLVPPARQPARIRQSNNQFFPSENLVKKHKSHSNLSALNSITHFLHEYLITIIFNLHLHEHQCPNNECV